MEIKTRKLIKALGSRWTFRAGLAAFALECGWLALTSRFPMAFDEGYHFGLIQFFAHRLNPIVTSQAPDTYKFGALIQNSSLLYHYLMSFPYRLISLFTHDLITQIVCLRLVNVALAVGGLVVMRKLLRLIRISDALANLLVIMFAFTPMVTDLSSQISYDNLLIPMVSLCIYQTVVFVRSLDKGRFDAKAFLMLVSLCGFTSIEKFTFLPMLAAIALIVIWKIIRHRGRLSQEAKKSFGAMGLIMRTSLVVAAIAATLLFCKFYAVNVIKYHNPVPQCNQILSDNDCRHYYAWNNNHNAKIYYAAHPARAHMNPLNYTGYWLTINNVELFSVIFPLQGTLYIFTPYMVIVGLLGTAAVICAIANIRKIFQDRDMRVMGTITFLYLLSLWARNYHDYLQLGWPAAIDGRYVLPVLLYLYIILALGMRYMLEESKRANANFAKAALASLTLASFLYLGGFHQYVHYIDPAYGRINRSNDYSLNYKHSLK